MVNEQQSDLPKWKGLFDWSMQFQDGTRPAGEFKPMSPEDAAWFREAMENSLPDVAQRMRAIKQQLDKAEDSEQGPNLTQREQLLEELLEIVEDVNFARDLRGIGGLPTLLQLLGDKEPSLRARAADVLAACAQNNDPIQQWLLEGGALPPLLAQMADADPAARAAAFTAVSCLIRNCLPCLDAFLEAGGLDKLIAGLSDENPRARRKAAQLLAALATERPALRRTAAVNGAAEALPKLLGAGDRPLREAALRLALVLAQDPDAASILFEAPGFETALKHLRQSLEDLPLSGDEREAAAEEASLVAALTEAQRNSPSAAAANGGGVGGCEDAAPLMLGPPA